MNVYLSSETNFDNNGLGFLSYCLSAKVTEVLNGDMYLEFTYPLKGPLSEYLVEDNIVKCNTGNDNYQLFRIKRVTKDLKQISVYAMHIFYDLLDNFIEDTFPQNLDCISFGNWILDKTNFDTQFSFYSNISANASARYIKRNPIECFIGDIDNSMVNLFRGELERDNYNIKLLSRRGNNNNVKLLFGKNIEDVKVTIDITAMYTRVMPVGFDGLQLPEIYVDSPLINNYFTPKIAKVEFSNIKYDPDDEEAFSSLEDAYQALRNAVNALYNAGLDKPEINIKINWLELSKTKEYEKYKALETVHLGDTITAEMLGLYYETRVVKTVYNVLSDRIENFEIGTFKKTINSTITANAKATENINVPSILNDASNKATQLITSAMGGFIYKTNKELFIMDTDDIATAQKVWRWNLNGLGYSSTGIQGPYDLAITMDGAINANFITAGKIQANLIEGLEDLMISIKGMYYNFSTRELAINSVDSEVSAKLDNQGVKVYNYAKLSSVFNHNGSGIDKLIVTGTAQIGYLKIVKGTKNSKKVTQIFHLDNLIEDLNDLVGDE